MLQTRIFRTTFLAVTLGFGATVQAADMTGAGASFPAPVYAKWADAYQKATGNKVNYQSIGSGGGIKQINAKTVDFGASDMPLKQEVLDKDGLVQFPTVIGGVVPVINVTGIKAGDLRLTGEIIADIYLGKITKWNDKAIAELNPNAKLPGDDIAVVRRADGSGTTFIFTNYLSKVSGEWKSKVGEGTAVQWPTGMGGKGNEGVSAFLHSQFIQVQTRAYMPHSFGLKHGNHGRKVFFLRKIKAYPHRRALRNVCNRQAVLGASVPCAHVHPCTFAMHPDIEPLG